MYEIRNAILVEEGEIHGCKLYEYRTYNYLTRTRGFRADDVNKLCEEYLDKTLPHIISRYRKNDANHLILDKKLDDIRNESTVMINKLMKYKNDKRISQLLRILNNIYDGMLYFDYTYICK